MKTFIKQQDKIKFTKYSRENVISGDSVTGDSEIILEGFRRINIQELFTKVDYCIGDKEYCILDNVNGLTYDVETNKTCYKTIKYVMRHKTNKKIFRVYANNKTFVDVTEDHSVMVFNNSQKRVKHKLPLLSEAKPNEIVGSSLVLLKSVPENGDTTKPEQIKLFEIAGFFIGDGSLTASIKNNVKNNVSHYDFSIATMNNIEEIEYDDYVYDIEIEDTHTFFANNILVHNTDSAYLTLSNVFEKSANKAEVKKFANEMSEYVNQNFKEFVRDIFNVQDDMRDIISTETDIISDKSLFIAKKKYAMHVVNQEGIDCNEVKYTGMEIIKSDTPKIVQKFLKDLVLFIMDGNSFEEITNLIDSFKTSYHEKTLKEIGIPMNVRTLNKYLQLLEETGSMKGFHYASKAAIIYNSMCSKNDVKINPGDSIRLVYVNHPDFKCIAIPADAPILPKYLQSLDVNWKKMWSTVESKIQIYLTPIGFDRSTRQKETSNELFEF